PLSLVRDHRMKEVLTNNGIAVRSFNADLLYEPWEILDDKGRPFNTFTEFWDRCLSMPYDPESPQLPPKKIISGDLSKCPSETIIFEDESEKGSNALLARAWTPGWSNADKALAAFINGPLLEYSKNRRKADSATTSFLSPRLHFGEVSVRKVFHLLRIKQVLWANEGMRELWATLLDADLESDALGWQYITGTLPDGREFDRIDNPQFEGYTFDPNGEYVRRWLPELSRLPTEWIHHPWDAPEYVLQAAGIELGSNYPLPIVKLDAAKSRLQEALAQMWQYEASSRAIVENGLEEGLGDSTEATSLIAFPQDM
nr:cryptochrome-1-like isoform X2 [Tanacetum cinerariifolium]